MALRQLMIRKKLEGLKKELNDLRAKDTDFETRNTDLEKREAELEEALEEITEETSEEDRKTVEDSVEALEKDQETLETEQAEHEGDKKKIEDEIAELEKELKDLDERSKPKPAAPKPSEGEKRKGEKITMTNRMRFFGDMAMDRRTAIVQHEDVQSFVQRVRDLKGQKRAVTGAELEIPDVLLELLRDNLHRYSKLASKVFVRTVKGKARQTIAGTVPEGVWTEAVGALNELELSLSQIEVDGYKVGGFIPVPNSTLEDSDLNLVNDIMDMIGQSIGLGVDKAIVYGTKAKMPLGLVPRLAQTAKPGDWDSNGPEWIDLHATNILKFDPSGMNAETFFANLVVYLGVIKSNYSNGEKFWVMNEKTKNFLLSKLLTFNAAGALVSALNNTMPIVGGEIIVLPFMSDYDIAGGYGSLYLLAERSGAQLATSEHVKFLEDQTVFKGTARYDGRPVFGEAFVILNINNTDPTTSVTFAEDKANKVETPYALPIAGTYAAAQTVNLYDLTVGANIYYTVDGSIPTGKSTRFTAPITVDESKTIKAIAIKDGVKSAEFTAAYVISG